MPRQKLRSKKGSFSIRKNDTTHASVMVSAAELGEVVGIDRSGKFIGSDIGTKWISRKRDPDPELDNAGVEASLPFAPQPAWHRRALNGGVGGLRVSA
jgi:hypothetical protein